MRLRFHPAFRIPPDGPVGKKDPSSPSFVPLEGDQFQILAPAGLSLLELSVNGEYRTHLEFLQNQPRSITFSKSDICTRCQCNPNQKISMEATCLNQSEKSVENLNEFITSHSGVRLPGVDAVVLKSDVYGQGSEGATKYDAVFLNNNRPKQLARILVNHGCFLDGFILVWQDGTRDVIGKSGGRRSEFNITTGEYVQGLIVRSGAWIDGIQFKLSSGRLSPWYGGDGGGLHTIEAPQGYEMVGLHGKANDWMEQIGVYYRRRCL
jgi:hypothetical protein